MAKKQFTMDITGAFRFCGNGQGIPGLPHEVTASQAKELGLLEVLVAAIKNGNYEPVISSPVKPVEEGE